MAKSKKKDTPVYAFRWDGNALHPDMEFDRQALAGIKIGEIVQVDVRHLRNRPRLRAYWAFLAGVIAATECAYHVTPLHKWLKKTLGLVDYIKFPDGKVEAVEGSIAIDALPEPEFIAYFDAVVKLIAERLGYAKP